MPAAITLTKESQQYGESCALCKETLTEDDQIIICPADATVHHTQCWAANNNHCVAYGCEGHGPIAASSSRPQRASRSRRRQQSAERARPARRRRRLAPERLRRRSISVESPSAIAVERTEAGTPATIPTPNQPDSTPAVRPTAARPTWELRLSQSCMVLAVALAVLIIAMSCFGIWAIADYIMLDVLEWQYRLLPGGFVLPLTYLAF